MVLIDWGDHLLSTRGSVRKIHDHWLAYHPYLGAKVCTTWPDAMRFATFPTLKRHLDCF